MDVKKTEEFEELLGKIWGFHEKLGKVEFKK